MDNASVLTLRFYLEHVTVRFVTDFVKSHVIMKQNKKADVWLGGQDIVGHWSWTNAPLSKDLLWAPGNHYFTV